VFLCVMNGHSMDVFLYFFMYDVDVKECYICRFIYTSLYLWNSE
jgi:hypothetical protein